MKFLIVFAVLLIVICGAWSAESTDESAKRIAAQAERTVWHRNREEAISETNAIRDTCIRVARSMVDNRNCIDQYAANIDFILKDTYESQMRISVNESNELLRGKANAQVAWGKFRDAECKVVRLRFNGGNGVSMEEQNCRAKLAIERIKFYSPE